MVFGRRKRVIKRILIVEDEPLVAFDNEHFLREAGYEIVATVDSVVAAAVALDLDVDLVLTDLDLSAGGNGRDVARKALDLDVPVMFVTGSCPADAQQLGIGCLAKPYSQRDLLSAIDAVDAKLAGRVPKRVPRSFTFFNKA